MIKDRGLKSQALRYVVAKGWFPQLELEIIPSNSVAPKDRPITDIDVLALIPDECFSYQKLLIDCKTKKGESPITRALWQRGVMDHLRANRGICILDRKAVELDHRHAAAQFNVLVLTETQFTAYAEATGVKRDAAVGHTADIGLWETFFSIPSRFAALDPGIRFSSASYWMSPTAADRCRKTIAMIGKLGSELDPNHKEHKCLVADLCSLFLLATAELVNDLFVSDLFPDTRDLLSDALLLRLYGGRERYEFQNELRKRLLSSRASESVPDDLSLPEWDSFMQFFRSCLDAPLEMLRTPLLMREVAWHFLTDSPDLNYASTLALAQPQAAKFAVLGSNYLCNAAKLPHEFAELQEEILLGLQTPPALKR